MSQPLYDATIPAFTRSLKALDACLDKAQSHADGLKCDIGNILGARLAPDMFPLGRQIQIACDFAKSISSRMAGLDVPSYEDKSIYDESLRVLGVSEDELVDHILDLSIRKRGGCSRLRTAILMPMCSTIRCRETTAKTAKGLLLKLCILNFSASIFLIPESGRAATCGPAFFS